MATKKHDLGVVTDLFQNGGQIRREFKLGRFLAVIEKTYPNRTLINKTEYPSTNLNSMQCSSDGQRAKFFGTGRVGQCPFRCFLARALPIRQRALNGH